MPLCRIWRESRSRFFVTLVALLLITAASVFYDARAEKVVIEAKDFHLAAVRTFQGPLFLFWGFGAAFLGLGGLLREKAVGTVDYTLSLPVSRTVWFLYRAVNGSLQALAASLVPALAVPVLARMFGGQYPLQEALIHGMRLGMGGMVSYSVGLLASTVFSGEFTSAGVGIAMVFLINNSTRVIGPLKTLNLQDAIMPMQAINASTYLIQGAMPWTPVLVSFALSLTLSCLAWKITTSRDF